MPARRGAADGEPTRPRASTRHTASAESTVTELPERPRPRRSAGLERRRARQPPPPRPRRARTPTGRSRPGAEVGGHRRAFESPEPPAACRRRAGWAHRRSATDGLRTGGRAPAQETRRPNHHANATMEMPLDVVLRVDPPGSALLREEALVGSPDSATASPEWSPLKVARRIRTDSPLVPVSTGTTGLGPERAPTGDAELTAGASVPDAARTARFGAHSPQRAGRCTAAIPQTQALEGRSPREHRAAPGGNAGMSQRTCRWTKALRSGERERSACKKHLAREEPKRAGPEPGTTARRQRPRWPVSKGRSTLWARRKARVSRAGRSARGAAERRRLTRHSCRRGESSEG
jgi:hypothetical protein